MKVLKTSWKQENGVIIENAIIMPKFITIAREDIETVKTEGEIDAVEWKSRGQITCLLEVYPDSESFQRRVYPISIFKKVLYRPYNLTVSSDLTEYVLQSLVTEKPDLDQDFSQGVLFDLTVKEYIEGTL